MIGTVEIRRNGIITIPDAIRRVLNLHEGDFIQIDVEKIDVEKVVDPND